MSDPYHEMAQILSPNVRTDFRKVVTNYPRSDLFLKIRLFSSQGQIFSSYQGQILLYSQGKIFLSYQSQILLSSQGQILLSYIIFHPFRSDPIIQSQIMIPPIITYPPKSDRSPGILYSPRSYPDPQAKTYFH
jgi:hypothetical protein